MKRRLLFYKKNTVANNFTIIIFKKYIFRFLDKTKSPPLPLHHSQRRFPFWYHFPFLKPCTEYIQNIWPFFIWLIAFHSAQIVFLLSH